MPIPDELTQAALANWRDRIGPEYRQDMAQPPHEFSEPDLGQPPPAGPSPFTPPSQFDPTTLEFDPNPPELEHGGGIQQSPLEAPTDYWRQPPPAPPGPPNFLGPHTSRPPVFRPDTGPSFGTLLRMRGG